MTYINESERRLVSFIVPINTNWIAVLAGYLGLLSIILIPAPISVIVSLIALKKLKNNPGQYGKGRAWFGLIMGLIGTSVLAFFYISTMF
jgi:sugar phosphate permease